MAKRVICLLPLFLLFSIASAGTVTLSGGCLPTNILTNTTTFNIANSGNDTALQMILSPVIQNAQPANSLYEIGSLGPDSNFTINVTAKDIKENGTSGAYFLAAYQQGGSVFTAVFPCLMDFGTKTVSQLLLAANSSVALNGSAEVTVRVYNGGSSAVDANVSLATPASFSYNSARYQQLVVQPSSSVDATFYLMIPTIAQSSYTVGALSSYTQDNLSHANFVVTVLSISPPQSNFSSVLLLGVGAVVVLVLALIGLSIVRGRSKKHAQV